VVFLWPFFEGEILEEDDMPIYFRAKNCEFGSATNCYLFKQIPFLHGDRKQRCTFRKNFSMEYPYTTRNHQTQRCVR
jgi:hypothetical protein